MFEFRESLWALVAASLVLPFGVASCSASLPPANTLTGPLAFTVNGSGGGSGPVVVGGPAGGAGVGIKILLADVSLADACVSGADITCAPSSQRVEIDIAHLGAIPLGMPLSIATGVDVLRQSVVGGTTCSTLLGTAISGSVTITSSDGMHIAGNFSVTMQAPDNSTSMLTGTFDVNFCQALVPGGSTTGGTTGSTSTGGVSSGGASGGTTTGGATTGAATSGGQTSGGTSSGTGTGGGTGGCAPGATWQGSTCVMASCTSQPDRAPCALATSGLGQCLGGACKGGIDLTSDPANCGFYGAVCPPGVLCTASICRPDVRCNSSPPPACPNGTTCADNPNYPPSGFCVPSACGTTDGTACSVAGTIGGCCGGTCQDTLHDAANCGGCGVACGSGAFCDLGVCQPRPDCTAATTAPGTRCGFSASGASESCCAGVCTDVTTLSNCGGCGISCLSGATCNNGFCSLGCATAGCGAGFTCVGYSDCVLADCSSTTEGLACATPDTPPARGVCCAGICLNVTTSLSDSSNCGACGRVCGSGTQCIQGTCRPPLSFDCAHNPGAPQVDSSGSTYLLCCGGTPVDAFTDPQNCLSCGNACAAGSTCGFGRCQLVDGGPSSCNSGNPCAAGLSCVNGSCLSTTCTQESQRCAIVGAGPPVQGECCGGQCVNVGTDSNNCHTCGQACPSGSTCQPGPNCLTVAGGPQPCDAGSCAAGSNCSGNFCVPVDCTGKGDREPCSFGPSVSGVCCNGVCADLRQAGNCRACGSDCPSGVCTPTCLTQPTSDCPVACPTDSICVAGQCVNGLCFASNASCATATGKVGLCCGDKACADLSSDSTACGTCDVQCPAGQTCNGGLCSGGAVQCNGRAGGYCTIAAGGSGVCCGGGCADVLHDAKNCGNCGIDCGTLGCFNGICGG